MKRNFLNKLMAAALALAMLVSMIPAAAGTAAGAGILDQIASENQADAMAPEAWVTVIVELDGPTTLDVDEYVSMFKNDSVGYAADTSVAAYRADLVSQQNEMQLQIYAINNEATFKYHYTNLLNGFAAKVQVKDIETIKSLDGVKSVAIAQTYAAPTLENAPFAEDAISSDSGSIRQMGVEAAWDAGYTGAGKVVGVFDTSIRHTHDMFQYFDPAVKAAGEAGELSNYMTQERILKTVTANQDSLNLFVSNWGCWFHAGDDPSTYHCVGFTKEVQEEILKGNFGAADRNMDKVPFAVDYSCGDLYAWDGDSSSHGTHVSGLTAGNAGPDNTITTLNKVMGSAKDSQIMFFKVFCEDDSTGCDEVITAAMDDAVTLGVNSFNLSLGSPIGYNTMMSEVEAGFQKACTAAINAGISVCISAGNDARDAHSGALVSGYSTIMPNSSKVGLPGCLYAPMTIASAQGAGYISVNKTTTATVTIDGVASNYAVTDNNATVVGKSLTGTYTTADLVPVGLGSEEEILAATGATTLEGALAGKIALVQRGTLTYVLKGQNVQAAGAIGMFMGNSSNSASALSASNIVAGLPSFGCIASNAYTALVNAVKEGKEISITFASTETPRNTNYSDSGPSSFTSWGVTEALDLKPDIMAPGGSIYSTGSTSDTALATMSGTSMASPNAEGVFTILQQYVDANAELYGVTPGTLEYNILINQLAASTAIPYIDNTGRYFSPRRQGAGMLNIANAINSKVVLSNDVVYNPATGETPRAKVNLGDKVGDTFDITFNVTNYGSTPVIFDVTAAVQTDSTTVDSATGRNILRVSSGATPGDALPGVMKLASVTEGAYILTGSDDINEYNEGCAPATIVVNSKTSVKLTVSVTLDAEKMAAYDAKFPNGLFVEGYVLMKGVNGTQNVNLPYMGFRGDWNQAEIFDYVNAYTDISEKSKSDLDYPIYHTDMLNTYVGGKNAVLGANLFTGAALPEYFASNSVTKTRTYLDTLRTNGYLSADLAAISPNGDGNGDVVFAALYQLRNAKAIVITVTDAEGKLVKTVGLDYEFYKAMGNDSELVKQMTLTQGSKYARNLAWDGTDAEGKVVADGQYNYNIYAITEYDYLNNLGYGAAEADVINYVLNSRHSESFAVKVDTVAPAVEAVVDGGILTVKACDNNAVQAVAVYAAGQQVGKTALVNGAEFEASMDVSEYDADTITVEVCDYAMNVTTVQAEVVVLEITEQPVDYYGPVGSTATFTVETNSDTATYQWFYSNNGWSWSKSSMTGADTNELKVELKAFRAGQMYKCVVTGADGTVLESNVVSLNVASDIVIVNQPESVRVPVKGMANFTVVAQGDELTYQWMYSNNGGSTWAKSGAVGATTASLSIEGKAFRDGQQYKCVITDANGGVAETVAATMNVGEVVE